MADTILEGKREEHWLSIGKHAKEMETSNYLVTLLAGALLLSPALSLAQGSASLRAGAARVDITPHPSELAFSTDSIRDKLFVRAIVVDDGEACAALVAIDAGGLRDNMVDTAVAESSGSTGCPAENYIISATHTHSGSTGGLGGAGSPTAETITAAIVSAVDQAKFRLAPARVGYGTAHLDLNVNRDLFNSRQEWRQEPDPGGASDKALSVVAFVGEDAVPIGVLMNYAMHPINFYLSGVVSADFPGDASRYVEELFDDKQFMDTAAIWSGQEIFSSHKTDAPIGTLNWTRSPRSSPNKAIHPELKPTLK